MRENSGMHLCERSTAQVCIAAPAGSLRNTDAFTFCVDSGDLIVYAL